MRTVILTVFVCFAFTLAAQTSKNPIQQATKVLNYLYDYKTVQIVDTVTLSSVTLERRGLVYILHHQTCAGCEYDKYKVRHPGELYAILHGLNIKIHEVSTLKTN